MLKNDFQAFEIKELPIGFGQKRLSEVKKKSWQELVKTFLISWSLFFKSTSQKVKSDWQKADQIHKCVQEQKTKTREQLPMVTRPYLY